MRRITRSKNLPPAVGPYSLAVIDGGTIFTAGQIGLTAEGNLVDGGVATELRQALANLDDILQTAGSGFAYVIKTVIYLTDAADFALVNTIYGSHFDKGQYPARETTVVASLPLGAKIEISMIAKRKRGQQ